MYMLYQTHQYCHEILTLGLVVFICFFYIFFFQNKIFVIFHSSDEAEQLSNLCIEETSSEHQDRTTDAKNLTQSKNCHFTLIK